MPDEQNSPKPLSEGGDPADFSVPEVNEYLTTADAEEVQRVLDLENGENGKHRVTVKAPASDDDDADDDDTDDSEDEDADDEEEAVESELKNYDPQRYAPEGVSTATLDNMYVELEGVGEESPTYQNVVAFVESQESDSEDEESEDEEYSEDDE